MQDVPSVAATSHASRGYVICSSPRSGSTYLVNLLKSTGVLGNPLEWIRGDGGPADIGLAPYPTDASTQIGLVLKSGAGATHNGIYGIKMFPEHFDSSVESRWAHRLPNLSYIYLSRRDITGQAISLSIARQTGSYQSKQQEIASARYDFLHIKRCLEFVAESEARWRIFFALNGISPLLLCYEEIVTAPLAAVSAVADSLGVPVPDYCAAVNIPRVQRGTRNDEWRVRFLAEAGDLSELPSLHGNSNALVQDDLTDPDTSATVRLGIRPGRNLLRDPGFVSDFSCWSYFGNINNSDEWTMEQTSQAREATFKTRCGPGMYSGWASTWTNVAPGDELVISADLAIVGGVAGNIHCDLEWRDEQGDLAHSSTLDGVASDSFRRVARRLVSPANIVAFRFRFYASQLRLEDGGMVALRWPKVELGRNPSIYTDDATPAFAMDRLKKIQQIATSHWQLPDKD